MSPNRVFPGVELYYRRSQGRPLPASTFRALPAWLSQPSGAPLNKLEYEYAVLAVKRGVMDDATFDGWLSLSFGGIRPGWFWRRLVQQRSRLVWAGLRGILESRPSHLREYGSGYTVFDEQHRARARGLGPAPQVDKRELRKLIHTYLKSGDRRLEGKINDVFPSSSRMLAARTRISASLALRAARKTDIDRRRLSALVAECCGLGGQAAANIVMYCSVVDGGLTLFEKLARQGVLSAGLAWYIKVTKELHGVFRQTCTCWCPPLGLVGDEVSPSNCLYLHCLAGRFHIPALSSRAEIVSRMRLNTDKVGWRAVLGASEQTFWDDVDEDVARVHGDMKRLSGTRSSWTLRDLLIRPFLIGTSGSAHPLSRARFTGTGPKKERLVNTSKQAFLNYFSPKQMVKMLEVDPGCVTSGVDKFEAGKLRLLLPANIEHWLMESIALFERESTHYRRNHDVPLETSAAKELSALAARIASNSRKEIVACGDFADFNILHDHKHMIQRWTKLATTLGWTHAKKLTADSDLSEWAAHACMWTAGALGACKARVNKDHLVRLVRGLWSGWRSTTFINTTYNRAYFRAIRANAKSVIGVDPFKRCEYTGDDSAAEAVDEFSALLVLGSMDVIGLEAQSSKQMVDSGRREFLRIITSDAGVEGSICRSIASLTSSDGQAPPTSSGPDQAKATNSVLHLLIRRGGNQEQVEKLRYTLVKAWARVRSRGGYVTPSMALIRKSAYEGGLGCSRYAEHLMSAQTCSSLRRLADTAHPTERTFWSEIPKYASRSAVAELSQRAAHAGLDTSNLGRAVQLHANQLQGRVLPSTLLNARFRRDRASVGDWYQENCDADEGLPPPTDPALRRVVATELQRLTVLHEHGVHDAAPHFGASADTALALALDACSPIPDLINQIRGSRSATTAVMLLGTNASRREVRVLTSRFGPRVCEAALRGKLNLAVPSAGVIPASHRAMQDNCLQAALRIPSFSKMMKDPVTVPRALRLLGATIDSAIIAGAYPLRYLSY